MALLSHYTTRAGLEGIAETKVFRATSFLDLNDRSEFFYAWKELLAGTKEIFLPRVPEAIRPAGIDFDRVMNQVSIELRDHMAKTGGVGHLYVTSFARGSTEDQDNRGILTLWDRYTKHEGYCLQFEQREVERMIWLEAQKSNYAGLGLVDVKYGVDKAGHEYRELCFQLAQYLLLQVLQSQPSLGVAPDYEKIWAPSHLLARLINWCAKHKDPCFEDEREVRIFAYPAEHAEGRPLMGIADVKRRHATPEGKKHIKLGEHWRPGITPRRIIIGPKADPEIAALAARYSVQPLVIRTDMPIA